MHAFTHSSRRALRRRLAVAGAVTAGALLLAACGGSDDSGSGTRQDSSSSAPAETGDSTASGAFNDADVSFAQGMIPHHRQAVQMAELAAEQASDPEIKELAQQIKDAQGPEIKTMQAWLKVWGKPESPGMDGGDMAGMDHGDMGMSSGMMSDADMTELQNATGAAFDRAFAQMMIAHHNGAIEMAEAEQKSGSNADAAKLAAAVVKGQSAEVSRLDKILDRL